MNTFFNFFKEKIFDFEKFFNWTYLTIAPSANTRHSLYYLIIFVISIIIGFGIFIYLNKVTKPRFFKKYLKNVAYFLIVPPFALIFYFASRFAQIEPFNYRVYALLIATIWLIWLIFLLYYLIVRLPKMFSMYEQSKRKEKFIKNGSQS
ncbi:MAG: hypothetical protein BWY43_00813 [candidate division WS2 bacterium ADurb.Bin280]|uniref:Uncharacterized protein n=1 Tax=candidate division WS2 bacterium ADurb.Bin280 TaxID=1852829 RepID=A0A1V5SBC8_9BACT|nr:MAG: hypothetical protein BWY43_00813 [candidate division WS2 bacterium ADurb.Bin280]